MLAIASAVVTANAYYVHPIIARVAETFSVSDTLIGVVPALNQIALALGIFLLLPLGDRFSNRHLTFLFVFGQTLALLIMAVASTFWLFTAGSTLLGFFTIAPYLLPAYASKRVGPERLGHVMAILTTGIILGILLARTGAGVIGEYLGWRSVYYIAAALMLITTVLLPIVMDDGSPHGRAAAQHPYGHLVFSLFPLVRNFPEILLSGAIQALSFGIFLSVWMGIGLHLTSPELGYGVDVVGYLAALSAINLIATPRLGAWADRTGPHRARFLIACVQLSGVTLLFFSETNVWLLIMSILIMNLTGPMIDVTGRMTFLNQSSDTRTRLMTAYIVMMFTGGGLASWAGTAVYDWVGWQGNATLAVLLSLIVWGLSGMALRLSKR